MNPSLDLILASASPRRAALLREAGLTFRQVTPPFDDSDVRLDGEPATLTARLAREKARSVAQGLRSGIVIGCDTLLSVDGHAVGKPRDEADARAMLESLFDRTHLVVSAFCLLDVRRNTSIERSDTASVTIHHPELKELQRYLDTGAWRGKAGGYNLAELQGRWRFDVEGDPTTVIGLPMPRLKETLAEFAPHLLPTA